MVKKFNPKLSNKQPKLRGTAAPNKSKKQPASNRAPGTMRTDVPAAYGYTIRPNGTKMTRTSTGAVVVGSDFAGNTFTVNSNAYEPAASILINPSYFQSAMLGNMARVYEKYRFRKISVEYIPSVPTSTQGQLVILSDRTVKNPFLDGGSSSYLSRALSQDNAVACPLWQRTVFQCETQDIWSLVDPLIDGDLDDAIEQEVQVYAFSNYTGTSGILLLHYEIEFKDPLYTFHSTVVPVPVGLGSRISMTDDTGVNTTADLIRLNNANLNLGGLGIGSIFRMVFVAGDSSWPTGNLSWASVANMNHSISTNITNTLSLSTTPMLMTTGTTLYGQLSSSTMVLYGTYEAAVAGTSNGALTYANATTAAGSWRFLIAAVRMGAALAATNQ